MCWTLPYRPETVTRTLLVTSASLVVTSALLVYSNKDATSNTQVGSVSRESGSLAVLVDSFASNYNSN